MRYRERVTIQRAAESTGDPDDTRGAPVLTWSSLGSVPGTLVPKSARELWSPVGGGPVASTHTLVLPPTDVTAADRAVIGGVIYAIDRVDLSPARRSLLCDVHLVEVP
jgi:Phage head-tail joining protein